VPGGGNADNDGGDGPARIRELTDVFTALTLTSVAGNQRFCDRGDVSAEQRISGGGNQRDPLPECPAVPHRRQVGSHGRSGDVEINAGAW